MNDDESPHTRESDRTQPSKGDSAAQPAGTETAVEGGAEPAKRQAERDWRDSSQESGE